MSIRFVSAVLSVRTALSSAAYPVRFGPGLNVIEARNSWGKSTLLQSLVFGLGLEGAVSSSHLSPLGEAMTSVIDLAGGREAVVESGVTLTVVNDHGEYLRTRRFAKSLEYEIHLIQTWRASSEEALDSAPREDYYVRLPGGATHALGFHQMLEAFLGWELPTVFGFDGEDIKLYLEVVLPLFYIEQKYGWAGLAPRVPTQYRIRSPYRRAAEFVLGLSTLERLKQLEELKTRMTAVQEQRRVLTSELESAVAARRWRITPSLSSMMNSETPLSSMTFEASASGAWIPVSGLIEEMRSRQRLLADVPIESARDNTVKAKAQLREAESQLARGGAQLRVERERLLDSESELASLQQRNTQLLADKQRLQDIARLERLGSELQLSSFATAHCPTCAQSLDAEHVATGLVLDVQSNLNLIDAERITIEGLIRTASAERAVRDAAVGGLAQDLNRLRVIVRTLKDELSEGSSSPSLSQVRERLRLESDIAEASAALTTAQSILELLDNNATAGARIRDRQRQLRGEQHANSDLATINRFRQSYKDLLRSFGLRSLPVDEITIGNDSLLPEQDGFELAFDINHGMSASDSVRSKWAFYVALSLTALSAPSGNALGVVIIDEPRQQETDRTSVSAFYSALSDAAQSCQIIVASSASTGDLDDFLQGMHANRIQDRENHMLSEDRRTDRP